MTCINCGTDANGKYCNQCGQDLHVKRLTLKDGFDDFWTYIVGYDGRLPRTLRDLTIRPGVPARQFISGNRVQYYAPIGYFFLMITLFLLLLSLVDLSFVDYLGEMKKSLPVDQTRRKADTIISEFMSDNFKIIAFLFIPLQAFSARYIFFRKQGLNFLEHCVLPLYVFGHWYWFQMFEVVYFKITGMSVDASLQVILMSVYVGFAYTSFISNQSKVKTFFKGARIYYASSLILFLVVFIIVVVGMFILYRTNPELVKQLTK